MSFVTSFAARETYASASREIIVAGYNGGLNGLDLIVKRPFNNCFLHNSVDILVRVQNFRSRHKWPPTASCVVAFVIRKTTV